MKKIIVLSLSSLVFFFRFQSAVKNQLTLPENKEIKLRFCLNRQPYPKDSYQVIRANGIFIITDPYPEYFYGQKIEVIGRFTKRVIGNFKVEYSANFPKIEPVEEGCGGVGATAFLLKWREHLLGGIRRYLPETDAGLLTGVLLGGQQRLPKYFLQNLRKTGTIHIVVASGANIAILSYFLLAIFLRWMRRRTALFATIACLMAYILMTGAEAPVIRAGIMAGFAFLAQLSGRESSAGRGLIFSAVIMLVYSPLLLFDSGFQLSFGAAAGLIWLSPLFLRSKVFRWKKYLPGPAEALATTISAQIFVWPIIARVFGNFNLLAPLVNALILWLVPAMMVLGGVFSLLSLVIGGTLPGVLTLMAAPIWLMSQVFVRVIDFFAGWDWAQKQGINISLPLIVVYYIIILLVIVAANHLGGDRRMRAKGKGHPERNPAKAG